MKIFIVIVGLLLPYILSAHSVTGIVTNNNNEPLIGASVYWINTSIGTATDINGKFELPSSDITNKKLVASFIGYGIDTLDVGKKEFVEFKLLATESLDEIVVKARKDGIVISSLSPIKTEQITQAELSKSACCDLAGCFNTQSSVQAQTSNVITNSKELRILGLSGVYNQVLINGLPMIQGLSYTYGISSVPGTMVDNIYIAKGANSVLQGYESISGQINVITKNPETADPLLLNAYVNSFGEKHLNANVAYKTGEWSHITAIHSVQPASKIDGDKDDFLDLPLLTRYSLSHTMQYGNEAEWGWYSKIGARFLNEKRIGGQSQYNESTPTGNTDVYGQTVKLNQPEIWGKYGYNYDDYHSIVFQASAYHQDQNSSFGTLNYDAQQTNVYANAQYEYNYSSHGLKTGLSLRYLNINEDIGFTSEILNRTYDGNYNRKEVIPGVFAENTMNFFNNKLTWIAGLRVDRHNHHGTYVTPRTLLRYNISPQTVVRTNIGTGWRTANIFSENINLLVSSRDVIFEEELMPEEALNYGINLTQKFNANNLSGYVSADYYKTDFQNQIFPDYDTDPSLALISNYKGKSVGNGFQLETMARFYELVELKVGYNYLDVYRKTTEVKELLPFNSKHRLMSTLSYKPLSNKFHLDMNIHWYGKQRLPNTQSNPIAYQRPDFSEPYTVVNSQFTYRFSSLEVYFGVENIFNFRQEQPIISWQDPFSPYFDTASVWGPTRGREFYLGFKYYIKSK